MSLVKAVRSAIFFLSVTALMCFVLDHLLCPASGAAVVANCRMHRGHMGFVRRSLSRDAEAECVGSCSEALRIAMTDRASPVALWSTSKE